MIPIPFLDAAMKILDKVIPDPKAKADALMKLKELEQSGDLAVISGQLEVNKIEAASTNTFVAGWRPAVGWVCASALAFQLVIGPIITWIAAWSGKTLTTPSMETELLTTLLIGMLGLGGMRTVEKLNNVASK